MDDLRAALRQLVQARRFTCQAVSTLALGLALSITTRRTLAFLVVGLLANWGPAMRAAHVDPAAILED
jgi:hypothetical protein